jgi:hypothetical protein
MIGMPGPDAQQAKLPRDQSADTGTSSGDDAPAD